MLKLIFALIAVAVAVPAGGLLAGVDRRLTARLQSRQGPPLLHMVKGIQLADVPVVVLSIDPCISCTER